METFKNSLLEDVWDLTEHHFVADAQKKFFKDTKESLHADTGVVVMDFSENYSFIVQNSVQGFFYNNSQATLHPMILYYKDGNKLQEKSFCIISDTREHFAYTVHAFLEEFTSAIKTENPWIKNLIYFSDGAPTQYKNK